MPDKFSLFLKQSECCQSDTLKSARLDQVLVDLKAQTWHFKIALKDIVEAEMLIRFVETLKSYFYRPSVLKDIDVSITYDNPVDLAKHARPYWNHVLMMLMEDKERYALLKNFDVSYKEGTYTVTVDGESAFVEDLFEGITNAFQRLGFKIGIILDIKKDLVTVSDMIQASIDEQNKTQVARKEVIKQVQKIEKKKAVFKKSSAQAVAISEIPVDQYGIDKYKNEKHDTEFLIEGTVIKTEIRSLTNTDMLTFVVGDDHDAITVKQFLNNAQAKAFAEGLAAGHRVQVAGSASYDTYQKDVVLMAKSIAFLAVNKKQERLDKAKEKRVELHLHTKMSNMDGVTSVSDYIDQAIKWGHEAIAFTDHNGLYAYPEIHHATHGKPIKPIYGVELDFVDDHAFEIAFKAPTDRPLKQARYVVFDIETTGLSATRDKIIEIGAVMIEGNAVVKTYQTFVNPLEEISEQITSLTGITYEMVQDAPTIDSVLPEFLSFAKDAILVAQNATFDIGFIKENARVLTLPFENHHVIDTMNLAKYFYGDQLKRFNLKVLANFFKVKLEQHHRADQDANATAQIFLIMLAELQQKGIRTYVEINNAIDKTQAWKHIKPHHVNVLVKNQIGYKNLFKVISDALTDHFHKGPRTLKSVLDQHREGLLVSSGCVNGDVFEAALNKDDDTLRKAIDYYDIIEVQPPEAYLHLHEELGQFAAETIEAIIFKIIKMAKQAQKIVIASGDVHYLEKKDVLYREIYIRTPLVGGGLHDLKKYKTMPEQYFLTTDEMLRRMSFLGEDLAHEIVVTNTQKINRQIDRIRAFPKELYSLPDDAFKETLGIESITDEVKRLVYENLGHFYGPEPHPYVLERVTRELKNIIENNFAPIYYMSHLLVKKSLDDGYLVGSRGSVGSSLVATLMTITEVNPLRPHYRCPNGDFQAFHLSDEEIRMYGISPEQKAFQDVLKDAQAGYDLPDRMCPICQHKLIKDGHDIPFETFLGFDGDKVPDIDLNFSGDYQSKAHAYVRELLGEDHTFRAGTIQTVAERNAFGYVKGFLEDRNLNLRKAQLERLAAKIEGVKRSSGQHPGGIVVVPKSKTIFDVTPIQYPADDTTSDWKTTHFDYHSFESNLLKLDILGHDDPTMIKYLMDYVTSHPNEFPFDKAQDIPMDDPDVYKLFSGTKVIGLEPSDIMSDIASYAIPEFNTSFTRQMLSDIKPSTFAGLVKVSGLSHGTDVWLKNVKTLIVGHPDYGKVPLDQMFACRDDIMVQLMHRGMEPLKAFEIMEFIRKGKPSKDPAKWVTYEAEMRKNNVPDWYIWSAGRIKYLFPKAHATAYVIMAVRIAWFKIHQPLLFYSAFFSKRASQFDHQTMTAGANAIRNKLVDLSQVFNRKVKDESLMVTLGVALEMTKRGFKFLPVDIEQSEATTFKMEEGGLRMPFASIEGLGGAVAEDIVTQRAEKPFSSLDDIKNRTRINKTLFEKMEDFGAFKNIKSENNVIDDGLFALGPQNSV